MRTPFAGTPLAGGWFATIWLVQADLAWRPQWLGLPGHNANLPCQLCSSPKEEIFDISPTQVPKLMSKDEWLERFETSRRFVDLFTVTGLTGQHVSPDLMHTKWCGVDTYLNGGCLAVLLEHKFDNKLDVLLPALQEYPTFHFAVCLMVFES